jgi:hypothetical protein
MQRRSNQDILLLIARTRASPNALKNFHVGDAPCWFSVGALGCALWQHESRANDVCQSDFDMTVDMVSYDKHSQTVAVRKATSRPVSGTFCTRNGSAHDLNRRMQGCTANSHDQM